jgi:transposase
VETNRARVTLHPTTFLTTFSNMPSTPNIRAPLLDIISNRRAGTELSPHTRSVIIGMKLGGKNGVQIADELKLPRSTVYNTINQSSNRDANQSKPRSGQPKRYTARDERRVLRIVQQNPKMTWRAVMTALNLNVSKRTLQRILEEHGISKCLPKAPNFDRGSRTAEKSLGKSKPTLDGGIMAQDVAE